jgi:hypothetical protein
LRNICPIFFCIGEKDKEKLEKKVSKLEVMQKVKKNIKVKKVEKVKKKHKITVSIIVKSFKIGRNLPKYPYVMCPKKKKCSLLTDMDYMQSGTGAFFHSVHYLPFN